VAITKIETAAAPATRLSTQAWANPPIASPQPTRPKNWDWAKAKAGIIGRQTPWVRGRMGY